MAIENGIISIPYQLHFVSKRSSEGWSSGHKTLDSFMQKYNILLEGDRDVNLHLETEGIQIVNVRQYLHMENIAPITDLFQLSLDSKIRWVIGGSNKLEKEFLKYHLIRLEIMRETKNCDSYYLFDVPDFNYVIIKEDIDYEWTLGTINRRYSGPYSLEMKEYNHINKLLMHS